ncbi:hypothetical protein ACKWTF_002808 [Chironomus riparius]
MDEKIFLKSIVAKRDTCAKRLGIESDDDKRTLNGYLNTEFGKIIENSAFGLSVMGAIKRKNENKIKDLERKLIKSKNDAKLLEKCLMLEKVERNVKKQKVETDIESTTKTELSMKDDENFEMEISLEMLSQIDSLEKKLDKPVCDDNMNFGIKNDHNDENGPVKSDEPDEQGSPKEEKPSQQPKTSQSFMDVSQGK